MITKTTRQRLSREQSREQTRENLLEASHAVFVQKGFAVTSVEDIAAAAGYTRGAFYSNFADKTELFVELLRRESGKIDSEFHRMFEATVTDPVELQEKITSYYSKLYNDDMCSILWMEAKIVAVRDDKFRASLNVFLNERHSRIASFVEAFSRQTNLPLSAPSHNIAIGLIALCDGIAAVHRCDPGRVNGKTAEAVLSWFLKAAIAMQPNQPHATSPLKTKAAIKRRAS